MMNIASVWSQARHEGKRAQLEADIRFRVARQGSAALLVLDQVQALAHWRRVFPTELIELVGRHVIRIHRRPGTVLSIAPGPLRGPVAGD